MRHDLGPPVLERRPGHDAVLHGEQPEQHDVDKQRRHDGPVHAAVDRLGNRQVADKGNRVQEGSQEQNIDDGAVQNGGNTTHGLSLLSAIYYL